MNEYSYTKYQPLSLCSGMELHHPIMSKLWDLGGGTKRQRHLIRATAIFVVDGCQFGPSSILGLKMEIMSCVD